MMRTCAPVAAACVLLVTTLYSARASAEPVDPEEGVTEPAAEPPSEPSSEPPPEPPAEPSGDVPLERATPSGPLPEVAPDDDVEIVAPPPIDEPLEIHHDSPPDRPRRERAAQLGEAGGGELQINFGRTATRLADQSFTGGGRLAGTGNYRVFSAKGRDLGLETPSLWTFELALRYERRYVALGIVGMLAPFGASPDGREANSGLMDLVDLSQLSWAGGAIDLMGVLPIEPLTIRAGALAGVRAFSVPLTGFDMTTCTHRGRGGSLTYPCYETATATVPYLQPRVTADVAIGKSDFAPAIGLFAGLDVYPGYAVSTGVTLTLRSVHWGLAP